MTKTATGTAHGLVPAAELVDEFTIMFLWNFIVSVIWLVSSFTLLLFSFDRLLAAWHHKTSRTQGYSKILHAIVGSYTRPVRIECFTLFKIKCAEHGKSRTQSNKHHISYSFILWLCVCCRICPLLLLFQFWRLWWFYSTPIFFILFLSYHHGPLSFQTPRRRMGWPVQGFEIHFLWQEDRVMSNWLNSNNEQLISHSKCKSRNMWDDSQKEKSGYSQISFNLLFVTVHL